MQAGAPDVPVDDGLLLLFREQSAAGDLAALVRRQLACSARDSSSCRNCAYDSVWIASSGGTSRIPWRLPKFFRMRFFSVKV